MQFHGLSSHGLKSWAEVVLETNLSLRNTLLTLRFSCFIASPMKLHRDGFPRSVLANPCNKITRIGRPVSCCVRSILILFCDRRNTKRRPDALTQLGVSREFCIGSSSSPRGGGIRTPDAARAPIPFALRCLDARQVAHRRQPGLHVG
jgi:hypothetical protein